MAHSPTISRAEFEHPNHKAAKAIRKTVVEVALATVVQFSVVASLPASLPKGLVPSRGTAST